MVEEPIDKRPIFRGCDTLEIVDDDIAFRKKADQEYENEDELEQ